MGSAREVVRLTNAHDAYRWLCAGVQVNYHTLSDFRKDYGEALDELLSANVASPIDAGVLKLRQVARDGMRGRASARARSFRCEGKLAGYLEAARERVTQLKAELEADPGKADRARQAARLRAAREREARVAEALARLHELEAIKRRQGKAADQARLDDGCRGDGHEDGRRRVSARVQPAVGQRRRLAGDRGRRGDHGGK